MYLQTMDFLIHKLAIRRWSFLVPILCYACFFCMIWTLSLPLKSRGSSSSSAPSSSSSTAEEHPKAKTNLKMLNSFEVNVKNSNFNSDTRVVDDRNIMDNKNEYLINLNDNVNLNKNPAEILEEVFHKADANNDGKLNSKELAKWIHMKILAHISAAVTNNFGLFMLIDVNPRNGVISWSEYHTYFLKKRGFSSRYVEKHDEKRHKGLQRSIKEQIMRDKASWMEAAKTDPDSLTVDEFLAFTHPESSATNLLALVDELYDKFDRDGDDLLTEDEFAVLQTEGGEDDTIVVRQDEQERRVEFRNTIDTNGDGKADRRELLHYVAPQSPRHSEHEAEALLSLADMDHDESLTLNEILAHPDLFLRSKMVDTARSFHDEF